MARQLDSRGWLCRRKMSGGMQRSAGSHSIHARLRKNAPKRFLRSGRAAHEGQNDRSVADTMIGLSAEKFQCPQHQRSDDQIAAAPVK